MMVCFGFLQQLICLICSDIVLKPKRLPSFEHVYALRLVDQNSNEM